MNDAQKVLDALEGESNGVDYQSLSIRTKISLRDLRPIITHLQGRGLVTDNKGCYKLTELATGYHSYASRVAQQLRPASGR